VAAGIAAVALGSGAAAAVGAAAGISLVLGLFYRRWLSGVTGDALGAATALSQTACLVAAYAVA
jgi:cobalamin synthase